MKPILAGFCLLLGGCFGPDTDSTPDFPVEAGTTYQFFNTDGQGAADTVFGEYWIHIRKTKTRGSRFSFDYDEQFADTVLSNTVALEHTTGKIVNEDLSDYFLMNGINAFPQGYLTKGSGTIRFENGLPAEDSLRVGIGVLWVSNGVTYDSVRIFVNPPTTYAPYENMGSCFIFTKRNKLLETWTYKPSLGYLQGWLYRGKDADL